MRCGRLRPVKGIINTFMSGFLTAVISVAVILGFMILIHEFGHYAAAKLLGVRVEVFSIGFGKRLLGFRRGETDYRIAAIPLGGYVKMSGENPMDERTGDPREFLSHPRWHRFIIAIAGPAMNIVLAIGLLTGVYMVHYETRVFLDKPAVISWIKRDSPAARGGLQPGDRVIWIDGVENPTWEQVSLKVMLSPTEKRYRIGFQNAAETKVSKLSPSDAFNRSLEENKKGSVLILQLVEKLVERKISMRTISGPIGIAQQAGEAAQEKGWIPLLALTSAISLNLGIFNLLPIPILDGGVILLLFVESIIRRDISLQIKERIYQAAFVFLVLFAAMVIYNDLAKTLPGVMQRLP